MTYLADSGDWGYGAGIFGPAQFDSVVAVGGTALYVDSKSARGFRETAWIGSTSGCTRAPKPSWQHDPGCTNRTAVDIAAVADPATPVTVYDTYGENGWFLIGGTSVSTPLVAGVFALAGNAPSQHGGETFWESAHQRRSDLNRITRGYNGTCTPEYLCKDGTHEYRDYGGPTGWGTPNGIGAF